jgi:hypothetical protein
MGNEILTNLYRMGSAATDAGLLDWLRTIVLSGAFLAILRSTLGRGLAAMLAVLTLAHVAVAQPLGPSDDEVERRLHFLESKLHRCRRQSGDGREHRRHLQVAHRRRNAGAEPAQSRP